MGAAGAIERRTTPTASGPFDSAGSGTLVFSAPHEREQVRDGVKKFAEAGTGPLAFALARHVGAFAMATAGEQTGDPNWDLEHPYTDQVIRTARTGAVVDIHMMQPRGFEVCLGLGPDHELSRVLWQPLLDELLAADVRVSLNWPFGSRGRTVVAQAASAGVPGLQVEMSFEVFDPSTDEHACVVSALAQAAVTWKAWVANRRS